jgi:hypothetical protein
MLVSILIGDMIMLVINSVSFSRKCHTAMIGFMIGSMI